jgi:hypothetical protein
VFPIAAVLRWEKRDAATLAVLREKVEARLEPRGAEGSSRSPHSFQDAK